jgi:hypothetical protein
MTNIAHYFITRFNVGVYSHQTQFWKEQENHNWDKSIIHNPFTVEEWVDYRLFLLETICAAGLTWVTTHLSKKPMASPYLSVKNST